MRGLSKNWAAPLIGKEKFMALFTDLPLAEEKDILAFFSVAEFVQTNA